MFMCSWRFFENWLFYLEDVKAVMLKTKQHQVLHLHYSSIAACNTLHHDYIFACEENENYMNHINHNAFNTYSHGLMPSSLFNFRKQTYFGVLFMLHAIMQFISTYSVLPFESAYCYNGVQHILSQDMAFKKWSALMPLCYTCLLYLYYS